MSDQQRQIQRVMEDIALVRRAISRGDKNPGAGWSHRTRRMHWIIQLAALVLAAILFLSEWKGPYSTTADLLHAKSNQDYQLLLIFQCGLLLSLLLSALYFMVYRGAKLSQQPFAEYVGLNFNYLNRLGLLADIFIKYSMFSLLLLSGKGEWVTPLFILFIGDYCFQARFFTLTTPTSIFTGVTCFCLAVALFLTNHFHFLWALATFLVVQSISLYQLGFGAGERDKE